MSHHQSHGPTREELVQLISAPLSGRLKRLSLVAAAVGFAVWLIGVVMGESRAWQAWHVNWLYFTVMSSAGVMIAAAQRITTARWSRPVVRFIEGFVAWLPVAFVMLLITMFVGKGHIYPWVHEPPHKAEKILWLGATFWTLRGIVVFGAICVLSLWYVYNSVRLDVGITPEWGAGWAKGIRARMRNGFRDERRELHSTHSRNGYIAVVLAIVFGYGWVVLAWDHSMSMDPDFYSTMYGWQIFMGGWVQALMLMALLVRWWRNRLDAHDVITETHLHDVGKLCFAFTAFWGYITFSQLLVIWYGNMGEETFFFHKRMIAPWLPITLAVGILVFVLPFFGLLGKYPKIYTPLMAFFAVANLVGMWLHRYIEIYPAIYNQTVTSPPIGIWEIGTTLGFLGLWGYVYLAFMDAFPRMRVLHMTSPYRDEVQVPVDPKTMEPLPAHE